MVLQRRSITTHDAARSRAARGCHPPCDRRTSGGGAGPVPPEARIVSHDRPLEVEQAGRRVEAELLAEAGAQLLERPQRVRLAARPVEGEEVQLPEALPQHVLVDERLE